MRVSSLEEEIKRKNTRKLLKDIERLIFKNKKRICWEDDDIAAVVTLRSISRKAYLYLRNNIGLPLPGLSTIRKWTRNLSRAFGSSFIRRNESHDQKEDRIMGLHSNAQVIIVRDKLFEVIKEDEDSGLKVVAIVSDMGGGNLSLWQNLQISTNEVSFKNPADVTREVWVFANIRHLIKLLRNIFLDYGIRLPCGTEVSNQLNLKENSPKNNKFQSFLTWLIRGLRFVKDFRKPRHSAFGIHLILQAQILEDMKGIVENTSVI
ncbi:hypothetical protein PR048_018988 [Dryococelus australis]|uniref:THAP9-like helix-turn-helix domain-containing protein n=1 Tax=Dryococelus australis TaxID=614101 RepID=A0ABQ9H2C2_9NEOP|nr:hypothetical protein PR048_018988 [Dryococelus australis]